MKNLNKEITYMTSQANHEANHDYGSIPSNQGQKQSICHEGEEA